MRFEDFHDHFDTDAGIIMSNLRQYHLKCSLVQPCPEAAQYFATFLKSIPEDEHPVAPESLAGGMDMLLCVQEMADDSVVGLCAASVVQSFLPPIRKALFVQTFVDIDQVSLVIPILVHRAMLRAAECFVHTRLDILPPSVADLRGKPFHVVTPCRSSTDAPLVGFHASDHGDWPVITPYDRPLCERLYLAQGPLDVKDAAPGPMKRIALEFGALADTLRARHLQSFLYVPKSTAHYDELCDVLSPLLQAAYKQKLTPDELAHESWAVVLRSCYVAGDQPPIVACAALRFQRDDPSFFATRFEAVDPSVQRTGLGRLLFECVAEWARFIIKADDVVAGSIEYSDHQWSLVAFIDVPLNDDDDWYYPNDNPQHHGEFLQRIGFRRTGHYYGQQDGELAFHRQFDESTPEDSASPRADERPSRCLSE